MPGGKRLVTQGTAETVGGENDEGNVDINEASTQTSEEGARQISKNSSGNRPHPRREKKTHHGDSTEMTQEALPDIVSAKDVDEKRATQTTQTQAITERPSEDKKGESVKDKDNKEPKEKEKMATAPTMDSPPKKTTMTAVSKKNTKTRKSSAEDTSVAEKVGVIVPPTLNKPSKKRAAKASKASQEDRKPELQPPSSEAKTGRKEKIVLQTVTQRDKKKGARTQGSTTDAANTKQTNTGGETGGAVNTRRKVASESDRAATTVGGTTRGADRSSNRTEADFVQKLRKKQLDKCRLLLTRNKQLVEVPVQRGEMHDRCIEDEQYFHGYLWRGDLDRMIKEDGQFLVRKSDWKGEEAYVISVMAQDTIISLVVKQTKTKKLYWVFNYAFRTIVELIDYHYRNNEPVDEASVYLHIPVFRQDWQYSHEQVETERQLGSGNFGTVHAGYLKRHPFDPPVKVAIKTLTLGDDGNMSAHDKNEFLREANLMLAVDHPNLVKLFGLAATRMPIQIVMELCNETLIDKLKNHHLAWLFDRKEGMLSMIDKERYVLDTARGMEYLHSCFIIHRDIAARNVLIRDGQAKISDFGLSIIGGLKKSSFKNLPTRWCAPETLAQGTYSFHTDVFSFGALIYEVFSFGRQPYDFIFKQGTLKEFIVYGGQAGCKLDPIDPNTPVWIKEMIDRCRQRDCYGRPLFPEIVKKLENQLGSRATSVGFWVSVRERFQKFIVDMLSIADYAAKEEEYIKADLDWLFLHTSFEELQSEEMQKLLEHHFSYLPTHKRPNIIEAAELRKQRLAAAADAAVAAATLASEKQKKLLPCV